MTAISDVAAERAAQDRKWGEQNHPDVNPALPVTMKGRPWSAAMWYGIPAAYVARQRCDQRHHRGEGTWADIALEEFAEAIEAATLNDGTLRAELIQCAAVFVAWAEAVDRRQH